MRPPPPIRPAIEQPRQPFLQPVDPRPLRPAVPIQLEGMSAILLEHRRGHRRKRLILDLLIGLQVPLEAPAIEIAGAHGNPVITDRHLSMQNARLKFEYAYPVAQ